MQNMYLSMIRITHFVLNCWSREINVAKFSRQIVSYLSHFTMLKLFLPVKKRVLNYNHKHFPNVDGNGRTIDTITDLAEILRKRLLKQQSAPSDWLNIITNFAGNSRALYFKLHS